MVDARRTTSESSAGRGPCDLGSQGVVALGGGELASPCHRTRQKTETRRRPAHWLIVRLVYAIEATQRVPQHGITLPVIVIALLQTPSHCSREYLPMCRDSRMCPLPSAHPAVELAKSYWRSPTRTKARVRLYDVLCENDRDRLMKKCDGFAVRLMQNQISVMSLISPLFKPTGGIFQTWPCRHRNSVLCKQSWWSCNSQEESRNPQGLLAVAGGLPIIRCAVDAVDSGVVATRQCGDYGGSTCLWSNFL